MDSADLLNAADQDSEQMNDYVDKYLKVRNDGQTDDLQANNHGHPEQEPETYNGSSEDRYYTHQLGNGNFQEQDQQEQLVEEYSDSDSDSSFPDQT